MTEIKWDEVKVEQLSSDQKGKMKVGDQEKIVIDEVKTERSFLLKTMLCFFGIMVTFILLVVIYQLLVKGDVDKSIEVLKLIFGAISPLIGTFLGFYFGKQSK
ncbi:MULTISPECIES: hypothetical protein [unclassified Paenibacillus]|uniref:hypothetical protein n=1 Tax=unclassified Paenibacillus TaxID=185978 RepID=UPI002783BF1C|nr:MULTISPECIES: hypothetical protein [unclassified Paenibacillus]MDQ0896408.1 hypothetical protein [Paenibacillus sp. V4I7]MDQ0914048.1 hypothetical protein [Paenibacillus sp. V4I5]